MPITKQDSNVTALSIAEESTLGTLGGSPVWYAQEPNSYSDFGGEIATTARAPINASRQRQKGTITDRNVSGGYNSDFTQTNMQRILQGVFFADAREKAKSAPLVGAAVVMTAVTGTTYSAAAGLSAFKSGHLVLASGFANAANNGVKLLSAASGTTHTTTGLAAETTPPAAAKVEAVGFQFPSADLALSAANGLLRATAATVDLTTLGLTAGEWVFIGDDSNANYNFGASAMGYARVKTIAATYIDFDDTTFSPAVVAGTGKTIRMFFGTVIRNEKDPSLIKRRSFQLERQLGNDGSGIQAEYLTGSVANEFTLNIPGQDKLNCDISFVPMGVEYRDGATGVKSGTRVAALNESAINTSTDLYRMKIAIVDSANSNPTALFGYALEGNVSINNGVTPVKALGNIDGIETSYGDFAVSGSVTALFSTVAAVQAINNNADVQLNGIFSQNNRGFVFDIPLLQLGGGKLNVEKDQPIRIPLNTEGAENAQGYTMLTTFFSYLPNAAM